MRSHMNVRENANQAERMARTAATGTWMSRLARLGYATKGVVYLIIGGLAAQLAIGHGGSATDQHGALQTIYAQPFGKFLLAIVALGLLGFAVWCFIQAIYDTEGKGRDAKGIIARIGYAVVGVAYGALAFGAYQLVAGTGSGGKSSTTTAQDWTTLLLKQPFGVALVVFSIIGLFLIVAAFQHNPHQAKGLDSALQTLAHQPFGPVLLGIVALGLIAYGVYSFVEARYRRVGRG